jgi:L-lactate dehydrogenase (cytochrome)
MTISGQSSKFKKNGYMSLDYKYPALKYLKPAAKKRIPHFVWEYLDSATGDEIAQANNRTSLQSIAMMPTILRGKISPQTSQTFLGKTYDLPFGVAPVGMSGLIWADAERHLARNSAKTNIPYTLSTVACQTPETIGPLTDGNGWFQLYPPKDPEIRKDMIARISGAGFETLVLTLDLPAASRRERQNRGGITQPPVLTARILAQIARRPHWALETALFGRPEMPFVASYGDNIRGLPTTEHIGYLLRTSPDLEYLSWLRNHWKGHLIVKGVLNSADAERLEQAGADAIWVSNHAGRQFDAAPASIDVLPAIRQATKLPIIFDSGVETGLDILRAIALGADFVMLGRAWHYALGALGPKGPAHLTHILRQDLLANMAQLGIEHLGDCSIKVWS